MNKTELVDAIAAYQSGTGGGGPRNRADVEETINALIQVVSEKLKAKGKVAIIGFGTFAVAHRKQKVGVNPKTGAKITIKAKDVPIFKAGKALKEMVK